MCRVGSSQPFPAPCAAESEATDIVEQRQSIPTVYFLDPQNCDCGKVVVVLNHEVLRWFVIQQ